MTNEKQIMTLPVVPLRGMTIMPDTIIHFDLNRDKSIQALESAMMRGGLLFLVTQKDPDVDMPREEHLYHVGTIAQVKQITKLPSQIVRVLVEGKCRGILQELTEENEKYLEASVEQIYEGGLTQEDEIKEEAMLRQTKELFAVFAAHYPKLDKNALQRYAKVTSLGKLLDQIAANLPMDFERKQKVLETIDTQER